MFWSHYPSPVCILRRGRSGDSPFQVCLWLDDYLEAALNRVSLTHIWRLQLEVLAIWKLLLCVNELWTFTQFQILYINYIQPTWFEMRAAYDLVQNEAHQSDLIRAAGWSSEILLRDAYAGWQTVVSFAFNWVQRRYSNVCLWLSPCFPTPLSPLCCRSLSVTLHIMASGKRTMWTMVLLPHLCPRASKVLDLCVELEFGDYSETHDSSAHADSTGRDALLLLFQCYPCRPQLHSNILVYQLWTR